MDNCSGLVEECLESSTSRMEFWVRFIKLAKIRRIAEVGVYRGDYASAVLAQCDGIQEYYMVDPWRHLDDWNKPANKSDALFEEYLLEAKSKTEFAGRKRIILRGKTTEVIDQIPDGSLDFCYIDGDHTLKGITIDLIRVYPKIREGGWIGGDDFTKSIWEHRSEYEPTLVFPYSVYFSEAVGVPIYGLPYSQFLVEKRSHESFSFVDCTRGVYSNLSLKEQLSPGKYLRIKWAEMFPIAKRFSSRAARLLGRRP